MTDCGWKESKSVAMSKTESKIQISLSRAATPDEDRKRLGRQGRLDSSHQPFGHLSITWGGASTRKGENPIQR